MSSWVNEMRISREQAQRNRARVLETASTQFRVRGFDGIGVGDLMKAAGFTHGGFYNHFPSKDALAAEALDHAWQEMAAQRARARNLEQLLSGYLSRAARDAPGLNCPAAALGGDVGRQSDAVRATFAEGLEEMIRSVAALLPQPDSAITRTRAVDLVNRMVGALMLSRAVPDDSPMAEEILQAALQSALSDARTWDAAAERDL